MQVKIHVDGASKLNNVKEAIRQASICVYVQDNNECIMKPIGDKTNQEAEWEALIEALKLAKSRSWDNIKIYSDSKLVVEQFNNRWQCKDQRMMDYYVQSKSLSELVDVELIWIPRSVNLAGIELEKVG